MIINKLTNHIKNEQQSSGCKHSLTHTQNECKEEKKTERRINMEKKEPKS